MIWLKTQLLVQPSISLFQFYYIIFQLGNGPMFEHTNKNLGKFLRESTRNLQLSYENNTRDHIIYALATDGPNELQPCILLGVSFVQRVVYALNDRFLDLPIFNATKLFSSCNYPSNDYDQITNIELWLERILLKFQYIDEEIDICKGELLEFMETLRHECENNFFQAWYICVAIWNGTQIGLNLCNFGKKIILIPSSIAISERGFSKQDAIKSHLRNKLNLKTLDTFMQVSLCGLEVDVMDWATIFNIWRNI